MNFSAKKSLGQNFLNNKEIISLIIEQGNINTKDIVLEVGPGTGSLTKYILDKNPKEFFIIEKDERLVDYLNKKFGSKIKIHNEDMMKFSYRNFYDKKIIIFGNLPYNISSQILINLINYSYSKFSYKKFKTNILNTIE